MAGIQTTIQLQDQFTSTLYRVMDSVNLGVSVMEELQQTMGSPIDMSAMEAARNTMQQAIGMVQQWDAAVQGMDVPLLTAEISPVSPTAMQSALPDSVDVLIEPILSQPIIPDPVEVLVEPRVEAVADPLPLSVLIEPDIPNPLIETPDTVSIPLEWESYDGLDVFTTTGVERFQSEIAQVHTMMDTLTQTQARMTQQAAGLEVLSPQAASDVRGVEQQMDELLHMIRQVEANPVNIGMQEANAQWEQLRGQLKDTLQLQRNFDTAVQEMDLSSANEAYLQLSQRITDMKRWVRDSFSHLPVMEVPIQWKTDSLPVFTGFGVERFQQEVQSATQMLDILQQTQNRMVGTAAQTGFFPTDAMADLEQMQTRLQAIGQQIEKIEQNPITLGNDRASAELEQLRGQFDQAIQGQQKLNRAVEEMDIQTANEAYLQFSQTIRQTEKMLRDHAAVEVPIQWKVDSLPVFTSSGVERFQQEVQGANQMLEQLSGTQNQIAQQSGNTTLFPPESFQSLNNLATRIDTVRGRIKQIENQPVNLGTAQANAGLEQLRGQLDRAGQAQQALNQAMQRMDVSAANAAYLQLSQIISGTEQYIRDNVDAEGQFQSAIQETGRLAQRTSGEFRGWQKAIILANQALGLIKGTLGQIGLFNLDGAFNRLDTMNRFQKTVTIITGDVDMANAALERLKDTTKGTAYGLDVAAKSTQNFLTRGMSLGAATDQVRVWADAVSFYGNGTNEQLENVIDAIGKIYSKGTVEQTQLDRLFDAGIGAAELYAEAVGRSVSEVKDDLTNRRISSADFIQTVTEALDAGVSAGAAKDAGSTWSATFANVGAAINRGWVEILTNLDAALASRGLPSAMEMISTFGQKVEDVLKTIGSAMGTVVDVVSNTYTVLSGVGGFFIESLSIIAPIILAVVAAIGLYNGAIASYNFVTALSTQITRAKTFADQVQKAAIEMQTGATFRATATQYGFNAALLACPITKIVIGILLFVAVIYSAVAAVNHFADTSISATGIILGVIMSVLAFIGNILIAFVNFCIDAIVVTLWNVIADFANFLRNVFVDPIGSIARLFFDLFDTVLGIIEAIASALDTVFGSNLVGSVQKWRNSLSGWVDNQFGEEIEIMAHLNAEDFHLKRFEYGSSFDFGYNLGENLEGKLSGLFDFTKEQDNITGILDNYSNLLENTDLLSDIDNIDDTTEGISKSLDVTEEDLKYLRDIAEQEAINRFTTAEIKVEMGGITNQVSGNMDLDGMVDYLAENLKETMQMTAAGVH